MAYTAWSVVFGEQPTAAKWNQLGENDAGFKTGVNFDADIIQSKHIDWADIGAGDGGGIWWEEIGRTTLGADGDSISIASMSGRKYLMIIAFVLNSGSIDTALQFNGDTGTNYAWRISSDGGADSTAVSTNIFPGGTSSATDHMLVFFVENLATKVKKGIGWHTSPGATAATAPTRRDVAAAWHNTSVQITRVDCINVAGGSFLAGSELLVLGHN